MYAIKPVRRKVHNMTRSVVKKGMLFICGISIIGTVSLYTLMTTGKHVRSDHHSRSQTILTLSSDELIRRNKAIQKTRIERIQTMCTYSPVPLTSRYIARLQTTYYYSPTYNFTFCSVAKSGSTFWKQAFVILENGTSNTDEIFNKSRVSIHVQTKRYNNDVGSALKQRIPTVLVSRDPYSRLFSAYTDKFYVPLYFNYMTKYIINQTENANDLHDCPRNTSFQDFLKHVVRQAFDGKTLDRHWAPIASICIPCATNPYVLVKQETFSIDVEHTLRTFNIEQQKMDILLEHLNGKSIQSTIPSIVETVYDQVGRTHALKCFGYYGIATRVWHSFQIQGYLKNTVPFPRNISIDDLQNASCLTDIIMSSIALNPMTRDNRNGQRKAALVGAYANVDREIIEKIKQVYKADFTLFDYDVEPPLA